MQRVAPILLVLLAFGCAGRARDPRPAEERWFPIERSDFRSGNSTKGKPTVRGSAMLLEAASAYREVARVVAERGVPHAIALDPRGGTLELAYLGTETAYRFRESSFPIIPLILSVTRVAVDERRLTEEEIEAIEPEKRLARDVEGLREFLADYGRALRLARRLMLSLPEDAPGRGQPGHSYGMLVLPVHPVSARLFGHYRDTSGALVAWVDPDGPAAGALEAGDRIIEVDGRPVGERRRAAPPQDGRRRVKLIRRGQEREATVFPERWPRQVTFVPVAYDEPNAFAMEGTVGITTGLLHLLETDDQVAVVLGHELGHILLGHVEPKVTPGTVLKGVVGIGVLLPAEIVLPGSGQLLGGVIQGVVNRFNRQQERDADRWGVRLAYAAGFDPNASVTLLDELEKSAPVGALTQFFSAHPPYPERREIMIEEIAALRAG